MIGPIDQSRPRFVEQAGPQSAEHRDISRKHGEEPLYELGRPGLRLPREIVHDLAHASAVELFTALMDCMVAVEWVEGRADCRWGCANRSTVVPRWEE